VPDAEQDQPSTLEQPSTTMAPASPTLDRPVPDPVEAEDAELPAGDYVSPTFWVYRPDAAFPHMRIGDKDRATWGYFRREIGHNWYVDGRSSTVGFVNRDEASILYNAARLFSGKRCLEIGCWRGWSSAHIAAGAGNLEIIDPVLADPVWRADVEGSLERAGQLDRVGEQARRRSRNSPPPTIGRGRSYSSTATMKGRRPDGTRWRSSNMRPPTP